MTYKMLALDLDNTLLDKKLEIAPAARSALRHLLAQGVAVTLATGRMFPSAAFYARQVGIKAPLATYNGGLIRSTAADSPSILRPLPQAVVVRIAAFCHENGYYVQLYNEDRLVVERRTRETEIDPDLLHNPCVEVGDFTKAKLGPTPKMLLVADPAKVPGIRAQLQREFGDALYLAASKEYLVEIMRHDVSKASALQLICDQLGIRREEVVCCGDNSNDAAMIQWAGVGVAVGNATPEVKAMADYTARHTFGDAVAEAAERFFA